METSQIADFFKVRRLAVNSLSKIPNNEDYPVLR